MKNELDRYVEQARALLLELERPSAYAVLGVSRETPASQLQGAFMRAFHEYVGTGGSPMDLAPAQNLLKNAQKRLELDTQVLDRNEWLRELESLRNRYALFDFLADV